MKKIVIAIDGVSSTGKSTMAKDLAKEIGYTYIDTGAMYRAVTLYCIQHNLFKGDQIDEEKLQESMNDIHISLRFNPETGRPDTYLNGVKVEKEIRGMEVARWVSPVATLGFVRRAAGNGQGEGYNHGRKRYRYGCIPGGRVENLCDSQPGSTCTAPSG